MTRGSELQAVIREGKRFRTAHLDVRILASPLGVHRIGLVVPKYGGTAVHRNRLKRRLRELVRLRMLPTLHRSPQHASVDVVIRARREAYGASFAALGSEIDATVARLVGNPSGKDPARPPEDTGAGESP